MTVITQVSSSADWRGEHLAGDLTWRYRLRETDLAELRAAVSTGPPPRPAR